MMIAFIKRNWSYVALFTICILFMIAEIINNRFWLSDFTVYYTAAERLIHGINLYQHPEDLHYIFKYSSTSAAYFIPFLILPLSVAKVVYWIFLSAVIIIGFYYISKLLQLNEEKSNINLVIFVGGIILALHYLRELHLGQVNYLIMVSYIVMLYLTIMKKSKLLVSIIWAAGVFIKPFGFIFLPYFIVKKKYKELTYFGIFLLGFALLPLVFYQNWDLFINQYHCWFYELNVEMAAKSDIFIQRNHTIFSVFARYLSLSYVLASSTAIMIYKVIVLIGIGVFYLWIIKKGKEVANPSLLEFAMLMTTIPLLAFTTENAFGFTALLIFIMLYHFKKLPLLLQIITIVCFLFIGANFSEIVGKHLSNLLDNWSVISIGAIALIAASVYLRVKKVV